jgi:putative addiction module component (TIGR02574 family)
MIKTKELFDEAISLPIEIRMQLVEKLLRSLNPTQKEIDKLWAKESERRIEEIKSCKVKTIPGEKVFKRIRDRLNA